MTRLTPKLQAKRHSLHKSLNVKGLTRDGRNWLINALDPFHDSDVPPTGFPDVDGSRTIVERYKQSFVVNSGNVTSGNYDAHIFILPELVGSSYSPWGPATEGVWAALTGTGFSLGTVNIHTMASGQTWGNFTNGPISGTPNFSTVNQIGLPQNLYAGSSRLVGIGVEVLNTTAPLNQQGQVVAYRMPQEITPSTMLLSATTNATFCPPQYTEVSRAWPQNFTDCLLFADSAEWEAKEGGYILGTFSSMNNPLKIQSRGSRVYEDTATSGTPTMTGVVSNNVPTTVMTSLTAPYTYNNFNSGFKSTPLNTSGLYFTGLSNSTTLLVDVRFYVEYAPTRNDPSLVPLSKPSARYDPVALELYQKIISKLPVGCSRNENPLGEWFDRVLQAVGSTANFIAPVIPQARIVEQVAKAVRGMTANTQQKQVIRQERKLAKKEKKLEKKVQQVAKKK